ncbi:MAG: AAA family ATPase [Beijerinckiaceae bacterium]
MSNKPATVHAIEDMESTEVPWAVAADIASWQRILDHTIGDKRSNLERAALELLQLAEQHVGDPPVRQVIIDAIHNMAVAAGIGPDEAQAIMARARKTSANGQQINGGEREWMVRSPSFKLIPFDEVAVGSEYVYIVKGIVPRHGLIVVWGPPKCGKSFWTFDMMMHVALGWPYRGRRVHQGPVVYLALEGGRGFRRRVVAWRHRYLDGHDGRVPFYLLDVSVDLIADQVALVEAVGEQLGGEPPAVIVIDTLNRALVGDENKGEDMAKFIRAADMIRATFSCAVIIVHHCGIQGGRPRGHTSLPGADDAQMAVERDAADNVVVTVEHMKDGEAGAVILSRLEQVELGADDDGDAISSCVIVPAEGSTQTRPGRKVIGAKKVALDILRKAIDEAGSVPPASNHVPPNTRTIQVETWRAYAYQGSITESDNPDTRQKAFVRAVRDLQAANLVGIWGGFAWII